LSEYFFIFFFLDEKEAKNQGWQKSPAVASALLKKFKAHLYFRVYIIEVKGH